MRPSFGRAVLAGSALAALAAAVACGGGGGGSGSGPATLPGSTSSRNTTFSVTVPSGSSTSSTQRKPAFVSPNAQSIAVAVSAIGSSPGSPTVANISSTSPNCSAVTGAAPALLCTLSLTSPVGNDTFVVTLYAGPNATGTVLGNSTVTATIAATGTTTVPVALGGVVAKIAVSLQGGYNAIPGGYPATVPVMVQAMDPSGATIVGSAPYSNPITLTNADTSGVTTLSTVNVISPATVVTLSYNPTDANGGVLDLPGLPVGQTTITPSASGVPATSILPGVFQYIADRFFGMGHTRTLTGTATVVTTTYNGAGMATGAQTWTYNITDQLTLHGGQTFNGVPVLESSHVYTYTQTAGVPAAPPETETVNQFRSASVGATSTLLYRQGNQDTDVNGNTISSPLTGYFPGTTTRIDTYPVTNGWQDDVLPHVNGAAWNNSLVPYSQVYGNAEVATFQILADNSWSFTETVPNTIAQMQSPTGTAQNTNNGLTTTISLAAGGTIPVSQETTSPLTPPATNYTPVNWYPGGGAPVQPLYSQLFAETMTAIPAPCNVPAAIATQAFAVVQTTAQLDTAIFRNRQQVNANFFVPGGVGYVCQVYAETFSGYRYTTGIIGSSTTITYTFGVQSVGAL